MLAVCCATVRAPLPVALLRRPPPAPPLLAAAVRHDLNMHVGEGVGLRNPSSIAARVPSSSCYSLRLMLLLNPCMLR